MEKEKEVGLWFINTCMHVAIITDTSCTIL